MDDLAVSELISGWAFFCSQWAVLRLRQRKKAGYVTNRRKILIIFLLKCNRNWLLQSQFRPSLFCCHNLTTAEFPAMNLHPDMGSDTAGISTTLVFRQGQKVFFTKNGAQSYVAFRFLNREEKGCISAVIVAVSLTLFPYSGNEASLSGS